MKYEAYGAKLLKPLMGSFEETMASWLEDWRTEGDGEFT